MMKKFILACVMIWTGASTASAEDCHPFYIGAAGGLSLFQTQTDSSGQLEYDAGAAFSGFLGWQEGPGRIEFEVNRFFNDIDLLNGADPSNGNVDISAYMLNGYIDLPITSTLSGYVGVGGGVVQSQLNSLQLGPSNSGQATSELLFAFQTKVGASYAFTERAELFAGYRYLGTEKGTIFVDSFGAFSDQIHLHSLETGLRFKF